nr:hypothetical protein [Bacillus cereus]
MFLSQSYYTTQLEDYIQHLYQSISVIVPGQIDMMESMKKLNIWLYFPPFGSHAMERLWHEVYHLLLHSGNQLLMPQMFLDYQEAKAKNFTQHFCVSTFMLRNLPLLQLKAYIIGEKFSVTPQFAKKDFYIMKTKYFQ